MSSVKPRGRYYENQLVGLFSLAGGICAMDVQASFYLMPFIMPVLHISVSDIGFIGMAGLVGWSLAGFAAGPLVDRVGRRKPVLVAAFIGFSMFSVMSSLAGTFVMLLIARLCIGLTEGPVVPITQTIVLYESSPHRRGLNMGVSQNFGAQLIGSLVTPLLMVWIARHFGWRPAFLVAAIPGLIMAGLIAWFVREPQLPAITRPESWLKQVAAILSHHNVRLCVLIGSCIIAWYFLQLTFMPIYLTRTLKLSTTVMSHIMSVFGVSGLLAAAFVPALSDRIGRRAVIIIFALVGAAGSLGVLLVGSSPVLIAVVLFFGCSISGTIPVFMAAIPLETVAPRHAAAATGLVMGLSQLIGGFTSPVLAGVLSEKFGLQAVLYLSAVLAVAAAGMAMLLVTPAREPGPAVRASA